MKTRSFDFSGMDSDEIGYYLGGLIADLINPLIGVTFLVKTGVVLNHLAENHAIDSSNSDIVSDNLFQCLDYLD